MSNNGDGSTVADIPNKAVKFDSNKPRMELLSPAVMLEVAAVFTSGAIKYDDHNWRKGFRSTRPVASALRHIMYWLLGEDQDSDLPYSHLSLAIAGLMMARDAEILGLWDGDDRFKARQETIEVLRYSVEQGVEDTRKKYGG